MPLIRPFAEADDPATITLSEQKAVRTSWWFGRAG